MVYTGRPMAHGRIPRTRRLGRSKPEAGSWTGRTGCGAEIMTSVLRTNPIIAPKHRMIIPPRKMTLVIACPIPVRPAMCPAIATIMHRPAIIEIIPFGIALVNAQGTQVIQHIYRTEEVIPRKDPQIFAVR